MIAIDPQRGSQVSTLLAGAQQFEASQLGGGNKPARLSPLIGSQGRLVLRHGSNPFPSHCVASDLIRTQARVLQIATRMLAA